MGNFAHFFWSSTVKQVLIATTLALACAATFAQSPTTITEPGKTPISAKAGAAAEAKVEARKEASAETAKPMDANGDGMISRTEYNNYHASMWKKMKLTKGMAAQSDMHEMMKLGAASK